MAARRLIINADDFGLTTGVNRGIAEAHRKGLVTSSTLMAKSQAFAQAAEMARANPRLSVGCHVVLIDGAPVLEPAKIPSLCNGLPEFQPRLLRFALAALRWRLAPGEVRAEVEAQIRALQNAGLEVTHVDTHKHAHIFPAIFEPLLEAARACGVRAVRNPFAPMRPLAFAHLMRRPHLWTRYSEVKILRGFQQRFRRRVAEMNMLTTDGSFGVVVTGALTQELFEAIIGCIPEGTWEFVCHPGYNDADLAAVRTRLRESRAQELEVLTSGLARQALENHGIELISYRELGAAGC
jgi:hopanoid biosynthesis associated protein HpnK